MSRLDRVWDLEMRWANGRTEMIRRNEMEFECASPLRIPEELDHNGAVFELRWVATGAAAGYGEKVSP